MVNYIVRRILIAIPVLIGITLITFVLLNVVPGDPVEIMLKRSDDATIQKVREQLGLNDPLPVQYGRFVLNACKGDLGKSFIANLPVSDMIRNAFPNTVKLAFTAFVVASTMGLVVGIVSAVKQYSFLDHFMMICALLGISAPAFWVATIAQLVFGLGLNILPISGYSGPKYMILPAFVLGTRYAASIARYTRTTLLDVIRQDYIRTARAKGLAEKAVIFGHALKNALIPVVTIMGMQIGGLLTGALMVESIFAIPGVGRLSVWALSNRDFPLVQGTVLFNAFIFVFVNIVVDVMYGYLDPRIRLR